MCFAGDLAKQQALRLLKVGIGAFVWDFWTWFFNGNCATYIQALPDWTNTWNAMPDLGFRRAANARSLQFASELYTVFPRLR